MHLSGTWKVRARYLRDPGAVQNIEEPLGILAAQVPYLL